MADIEIRVLDPKVISVKPHVNGVPLDAKGIAIKGDPGRDGTDGRDGRDGVDGKDGKPFTYDMFTPEQLEGLKGPRGDKGEQGESITGPAGPQGERGPAGESIIGPQGPKGDKGEKGDKGDSIKGDKGDRGPAGDSYTITEADYRAIADMVPTEGMTYYIVTFNGSAFTHEGTTLTFEQLKTLCLDTSHFVYAQYSNRLYIPQYISNNNLFFQASYIDSDVPQIHRISINNLNQVSQYNYNLAKTSDVPTDEHINNLINTALGVVENGTY